MEKPTIQVTKHLSFFYCLEYIQSLGNPNFKDNVWEAMKDFFGSEDDCTTSLAYLCYEVFEKHAGKASADLFNEHFPFDENGGILYRAPW